MPEFDQKDQELLYARMALRAVTLEPLIGDFVVFPTGEVERISHMYDDGCQTSPMWAGSFYLCSDGGASFSGSLNPSIPKDTMEDAGETREGRFWFFHHDWSGPSRGVTCVAPCRVWRTSAEYKGYITRGII